MFRNEVSTVVLSLARVAAQVLVLFCIPLFGDAAERPNVVLIFTDDQGYNDVGCYGSEIPTPHIDRLASEGLRFTSWYSASSICTPSRYGLLTGRNPVRSRDQLLGALMFLSDEDRERGIRSGETTIAESFRASGYRTALIGKWHLGHGESEFLPVHHGFDLFKGHTGGCIDYFTMTYGIQPDWYENTQHVDRNGYATELITDEAVRFLEDQQPDGAPFFLYLAYNAPHFGKGWSPADDRPVNIMQAQAKDLQRVAFINDKIRREFAAMVVSLDDGIGRIHSVLQATKQDRDTLVIFLTDHGGDPDYGGSNLPFRGDKATLFEGGLRVPCIICWPGQIAAGRTSDVVASSLDLFPTLCALCGVERPESAVDGINLSAQLLRQLPAASRDLYWETGSHTELNRGRWQALRTGHWKFVRQRNGREFVFNLKDDPQEQSSLVQTYPDMAARLRKQCDHLAVELRQPTESLFPAPADQ